ncbi:MAG: ACP S-malonyltransferase [Fusobacteria bacterium]|nr:ACP S-malonyltransferase [Fusobacteriota bacterium]
MSKIAFVFPGQGTQFIGMGKDLYELEEFKGIMDDVFSILPVDLKTAMHEGPIETLTDTQYTQPAIVLVSTLLCKKMLEKITPDYFAGHSVGEYSALANNVLSIKDTTFLAYKRGKHMSEVGAEVNGTMAAVLGLDSDRIIEVLKSIEGKVAAVNFNEPKQTVISGSKIAIEAAAEPLKAAGAKRVIGLSVSGPFHSILMKPAADKLKVEFDLIKFGAVKYPVIANTTAEVIDDNTSLVSELYAQAFGPVKWVETIQKLKSLGVTKIYEVGPGKVLAGLIKKIDAEIEVINIQTLVDIDTL